MQLMKENTMGQCFTLANLDRKEIIPSYNKLLEDMGYPTSIVEDLEILLLDSEAINLLKSKNITLDPKAGTWAHNRIMYVGGYAETLEFCDAKDLELARRYVEEEDPEIPPEEIEECLCLSTAIQGYAEVDGIKHSFLHQVGYSWESQEPGNDYYLINHDKGEYLSLLSYAKRVIDYLEKQLQLTDPYHNIIYPLLILTLHIALAEEINDAAYLGAWKGQRISISLAKPDNMQEITPLFYLKNSELYAPAW
jgi:hypothetical protein